MITLETMKIIANPGSGKITSVSDCVLMRLPKIENPAGNITPINGNIDVPFSIERVYYLYDVPGGVERGGHAHRQLHQLIIAGSGSFDLLLDDGNDKNKVTLNRPYMGLYLVPGIWRELVNFSSGAICMVLASHKYDESDYFRNYDEFLQYKSEP